MNKIPSSLVRSFSVVVALTGLLPGLVLGAKQQRPARVNPAGQPVVDAKGKHINYGRKNLGANPYVHTGRCLDNGAAEAPVVAPHSFVPSTGSQRPFWQYAVFGSGIGVSNIVIGPAPAGGGPREIIVGGNSGSSFGEDDFWQVLRRNATTGNYDSIFVSPLYSSPIEKIGLANVIGDSKQEIVVMLADGRIYLFDFESKTELGYINTGAGELRGLSLTDLNNDGYAELIVTTVDDLFVFNNAGSLLWQVAGAGGYNVVAGQMDNDPATEIAATNGKVVDATSHAVQWTRNTGFGVLVRLAPLPGSSYQQLIVAEAWGYVYSYDIALQLPRWSIETPQDIEALRVADVDNDGTPEILIGDGQWGTVHVHDLNTQQQKWFANNPEHGVTDIAIADVDNDGVVDLLWGAGWTSTGSDYLYVADTDGTHDIKWQSVDLEGPFLGPVIGDLDGDGQLELVICSSFSESTYSSGRILVFDLATLALRAISDPVADNAAWTGVKDLKLRDLEGDGHMEIVIAADHFYDGAIEIYGFGTNNTFIRKWANTTEPSSPFNFVEVADLDNNGIPEVIGGAGSHVYIFNYPSTVNPWQSVNFAGSSSIPGLIVRDLDGNGSKEIAALASNGDLYTYDGPTRQLRNLLQSTGGTLLSSSSNPSVLITSDSSGVGHFLKYASNSYSEILTPQLNDDVLDGINVSSGGVLWTGANALLKVWLLPAYDSAVWQSPLMGNGFGRFVATDARNGQSRVFSSASYAALGFTYALPAPTLLSAVSRKTHGAAGAFDIALPLAGAPGVECRTGGGGGTHTLVVTLNEPVATGHASVTSGIGAVQGQPSFSGNQMFVTLTGVADAQRVTLTSTDLAAIGGAPLSSANFTFAVLEGDVNGTQGVNATDVSQTKLRTGQTLDASNVRSDTNCNGTINASDVSSVKLRSGNGIP